MEPLQKYTHASQVRNVIKDASGVVDHEPLPLQVPQYLQLKETTSFKLNSKGCLTGKQASSLEIDSFVDSVFHRLSWRGPGRYTTTNGNFSSGVPRYDQRGILVAILSTAIRFHNQVDCKIEVRSNTPKARMPHTGNVAYRTPEQIHEVNPFETLVLEQKWGNSNNDCPYQEMQGSDILRAQHAAEYPLLDFYVIKPDNVPQSQVPIKDDSEIFKVTAVITYVVARTPSALLDKQTLTPADMSPNFYLKDLSAFSRMYEVDPVPSSVEGGDTVLSVVPAKNTSDLQTNQYTPNLAKISFQDKSILTFILVSHLGDHGSFNGIPLDFIGTSNGSIAKYPVDVNLRVAGNDQLENEPSRRHFAKISGASSEYVAWQLMDENFIPKATGVSNAVWALMDEIRYWGQETNLYSANEAQSGLKQVLCSSAYAVKGVRVVRDNKKGSNKRAFDAGTVHSLEGTVSVLGIMGETSPDMARDFSEVRARVVKGRR